MKKIIQTVINILILAVFLIPTFVFAADPPTPNPGCPEGVECGYVMLAPIFSEQVGARVTMSDYLSKIYNLLFLIAGVIATVMLIIGGFQYMISEVASTKSAAKERMSNAIWGLLLAIFSYTILYTLNPDLLNIDFKLKKIKLVPPPVVQTPDPNAPDDPNKPPQMGPWPSDAKELSMLPSGVRVYNDSCTTIGQEDCTSLYSMPTHVFSKLGDLKEKSGVGTILITGGTEYWAHQSHGTGKAIVDIDKDEGKLDSYIRKGTKTTVSCGLKNAPKYSLNGGIYVDEGNHWHVCY